MDSMQHYSTYQSQFIEMFGDQNANDKGWPESLVKDEFKLSMGKTPARNNPECWDNGTNKWVSISDMSSYTRYTGDTSEYITDYAVADSGIKAVPKGTIIMSFKLSIGRTAITSEDIYTNEAIMAFAGFDENKFNIDFLHFLIANKNWLLGAKQAVKGQTLNKESIGNAKIIIPPIETQEEFASIYNQADKSKFTSLKSQFIEMFSSESNKVLLEDIVFVKDDCRKPINEGVRSEMKEGELYPYYGATGVVDYINDYITDEELLCVAEDCGNYNAGEESAYIIRGKAWVNNHAHLVKMKDSCDIKYLYYYLKIANLMPYVSGTTRLKLTQKKLREIPVVLPTKDKQTTFVAIAEQADKSKYIN